MKTTFDYKNATPHERLVQLCKLALSDKFGICYGHLRETGVKPTCYCFEGLLAYLYNKESGGTKMRWTVYPSANTGIKMGSIKTGNCATGDIVPQRVLDWFGITVNECYIAHDSGKRGCDSWDQSLQRVSQCSTEVKAAYEEAIKND